LLLAREDINPNTADTEHGRTPLLWAAEGGHVEVARLLLAREDINPNTADTERGRTPLLWAAVGGHDAIVKMLLEREDINPDIPGLTDETALELATSWGHVGVVQLLSEPKSSPPILIGTEKVPDRFSPESSTCLSPPKPLPPATRPLLAIAIPSFVLISSIFLFYLLAPPGSSLSALSLQSLYK